MHANIFAYFALFCAPHILRDFPFPPLSATFFFVSLHPVRSRAPALQRQPHQHKRWRKLTHTHAHTYTHNKRHQQRSRMLGKDNAFAMSAV